jgi:type II secretory pathway pseudopilin PulG
MTFSRTTRSSSPPARHPPQQGYVLLSLLLFMALLVIAAAAAAPDIAFEIKRDREEELVHRGVEYSRAIQRFAKANARYPLRIEELQSSGGMKYIRKLYKDPITGGDFRLLYMSDVRVATNTRVAGDPGFVPPPGTPPPAAANAPVNTSATVTAQDPSNPDAGTAAAGVSGAAPATAPGAATPGAAQPGNNIGGGGAIVGVVSKSKVRGIREYNKKTHYNEWLFFYLPNFTGSQRIKGPTSLTPPTANLNAGAVSNQTQPGQPTTQPLEQK